MKLPNSSAIRGLRDIRTHSGRVDTTHIPYMRYMRITALEMEKARREKEKSSAQARIRSIDLRLSEIEDEKRALLAEDGERSNAGTRPRAGAESAHAPHDINRGFRLKY